MVGGGDLTFFCGLDVKFDASRARMRGKLQIYEQTRKPTVLRVADYNQTPDHL